MPNVLTMESSVTCGHDPGKVKTTSSAKLTVNKQPVLLESSIDGQSIVGCGTVAKSDTSGPTDKPCTKAIKITVGPATKLTVSKQPAILDTLKGSTDGLVGKVTPQLLLGSTAIQTKLTAS